MTRSEGICELCGHHVALRQKAHIIAEGPKRGANLLMLCPTCHLMFDTHLKPKIWKALSAYGICGLPQSWKSSIHEQGAKASASARKKKGQRRSA